MSHRFRFVDVGVPDGFLTDGGYETSVETPWHPRFQRIGEVVLGQRWTPEDEAWARTKEKSVSPFSRKRRGEWGWYAVGPAGAVQGPFSTRGVAAEALLAGAPAHIRTGAA